MGIITTILVGVIQKHCKASKKRQGIAFEVEKVYSELVDKFA
jgi:hypothetical protein